MKKIVHFVSLAVVPLSCLSCNLVSNIEILNPDYPKEDPIEQQITLNLNDVAYMLSCLPLATEQLREVHDAASASLTNGYDEEYTMSNIFKAPGGGVGDETSKASKKEYVSPLRDLISTYYENQIQTKAGSFDAQAYLDALSESDMQIYWPNSENWDGEEYPAITFDPGPSIETNMAYLIGRNDFGLRVVDSILVDENYSKHHPVWVVNRNDDGEYIPLKLYSDETKSAQQTKSGSRKLMLHSFTMLRNYDTWFGGASEFFIKLGGINGFNAATEAELKLYYPSVTDFMLVVKRSEIYQELVFDSVILTDFTNQMENLAFLVTEDDGGTRTTWKCSATVKIKSKSYGFDVELPLNEKDDIVWRGQLSSSFFQAEDRVEGRFGDVKICFELQ